jgi:hypothetical protein
VNTVIDYGDLGPEPQVICRYRFADSATMAEVLIAANVTLEEATGSTGFICRVNGYPTAEQAIDINGTPYQERCQSTPPQQAYWTLWVSDGDKWTYAQRGYAQQKPTIGGAIGLSFSHGAATEQLAPRIPPLNPDGATDPAPSSRDQATPRATTTDDRGSFPWAVVVVVVIIAGFVVVALVRRRR